MITTYFIRHTESKHAQLTEIGQQEAIEYKNTLLGKIDEADHYLLQAPPAKRFTDTATLMICPDIESLDTNTKILIDRGLLKIDPKLDYTQFEKHERDIEKLFDIQAKKGELMKDFYMRKSDTFLPRNPKLSTYSTISHIMSNKILEIFSADNIKSNIIVTREFFWPVFRAKIMEIENGVEEANKYAKWYSDVKENNPSARLDINELTYNNAACELHDDYGSFRFHTSALHEMSLRHE